MSLINPPSSAARGASPISQTSSSLCEFEISGTSQVLTDSCIPMKAICKVQGQVSLSGQAYTLGLSASSGTIYSSSSFCSTPISSLTFPSGVIEKSFYYKPSVAGSYTITVSNSTLSQTSSSNVVVSNPGGASGTLDTSFGTSGTVMTQFGVSNNSFGDVAVQPDGKIISVGNSNNGSINQCVLTRHSSTGTLDTSYGTGGTGIVLDPMSFSTACGFSAAKLQTDGKLIALGTYAPSGNNDILVARFLTDGTLDTTFDTDGWTTLDFFGNSDSGAGVAIQPDGKIVVVGTANNGSQNITAVARLNSDGSLDTSFGTGGKFTFTVPTTSTNSVSGVALQRDGSILVLVGPFSGIKILISVSRVTSSGVLDTTFGSSGSVIIDPGALSGLNYGCFPHRIFVQPDDSIVVNGRTESGGNRHVTLAKFTASGALDTAFGNFSGVYVDTANGTNVAWGMSVLPDGNLLPGGSVGFPGSAFLISRFTANGALDTTFGTAGLTTTPPNAFAPTFTVALANTVVVQPDGSILLGGTSRDTLNQFSLAKYWP